MIRLLPYAVELILVVFCLVDVIVADESRIRNLGKWFWILLIVLIPLAGAIAWLVAGRPVNAPPRQVPWPSRTAGYPEYERPAHLRPRAPDDDPEFLAKLRQDSSDHERMLSQWEADLRRREAELRRRRDPQDSPPEPDAL